MKIYAKPWLASACSISFHSALIQFEVMAATSGSVVLLVGRVIALPMAAAMMQPMADHCVSVKFSLSSSMPMNAAMAGSVASAMPKVAGGKRRKASISSV